MGTAERGDLDDFRAEPDVYDLEAAPDDATVASVATSKSFGLLPSNRSRTLPPTR
jgi:hypothetical protein